MRFFPSTHVLRGLLFVAIAYGFDRKEITDDKKGLSCETDIDELSDYTQLQNKKIVGIDPGLCDLIYCVVALYHTSTYILTYG